MVSTDVEKDSIHNHDEREPSSTNNSIGPLEKALSCPDEQQPAVDPSAAGPPLSPDGGFGWVCVACVFFINAHTWGLNSSYGVFLSYYLSSNYFPGATPLQYAFVGGISIASAQLVSPICTLTTRRFGTRTTLLIGVCFLGVSMIGASFAVQIWQLFLSQGVCFGIGMGFLFNGSVGIVPQWFSKRRSLANGIGTAGSGLGGLAYSLAAGALIPKVGLGWTFRILGIIAFVVNFICSIIIKDRNKIIGVSQLAFDYRLFKRPEFIMLQGWGVFTMLGYVVLLFSIPNYALSVGLTAEQGAVIGALLNLGQGLGRPFVGYFSDSAGRINIAGSLTFVSGVLCLVVWVFAKSYGVLIFFAILSGTVAGTFWTTVGPVSAEVVGLKELPSCLSITWLVLVIPTTFSEAIALELRRPSGDIYLDAQVYTGFAYIAAALCAWGVRAWKVGQLECLAAEQGRPGEEVDVSEARTIERTVTQESKKYRSSFVRRMFIWKRV